VSARQCIVVAGFTNKEDKMKGLTSFERLARVVTVAVCVWFSALIVMDVNAKVDSPTDYITYRVVTK
jgi:hypothetical protein